MSTFGHLRTDVALCCIACTHPTRDKHLTQSAGAGCFECCVRLGMVSCSRVSGRHEMSLLAQPAVKLLPNSPLLAAN